METNDLIRFLIDSNKAGYAGGEAKKWVKEKDSSTTIPFEKGDFRSHDNFFGGEPYGGRVVVFHCGKPVWIMVYYGWVAENTPADPVYAILRQALMRMPEEAPLRGPEKYEENGLSYLNKWEGDVSRYSGEEKILNGESILYKANYFGGLVDRRQGV